MGVTETHVEHMELEEIKGERKLYNIYHNGIIDKNKYTGVGIIIEKEICAVIDRISVRICTAEIDLGKGKN